MKVIIGDCLRPRPVLRRLLAFEIATIARHAGCDAAPVALTDLNPWIIGLLRKRSITSRTGSAGRVSV